MTLENRYFLDRDECPVCGSKSLTEIYTCSMDASPVRDFILSHYRAQGHIDWKTLGGARFEVFECVTCTLIFQRKVPTPEMLEIIYTRMILPEFLTKAENDLLTLENFQQISGELTVIFRMTGKAPNEISFLDFGFGHGRWARVARAMGATVYATEIGEDKRRLGSGLGVRMIDDADIDTMQFDIVHTEQVFEHLVDPAEQFKRLARATRSVMKVAVPRPRPLKALLQSQGMPKESPFDRSLRGLPEGAAEPYVAISPLEHLNAFTPKAMRTLADVNRMAILSRARRTVIALDLTSPSRLARSVIESAKMAAKMAIRPETGYYLFRPLS